MQNTKLFIDFDSTFTQVEALEELLTFSIPDDQERAPILAKLEDLTNMGMEGKIDYMDSLNQRMALLQANSDNVQELIVYLKTKITPSILRNRDYLLDNKNDIYIISNGFEDFIVPVISEFGLREDQVFANRFVYDGENNIVGIDKDNPLAKGGGKPIVIKSLNLPQTIIMLGDGYNDYQAKQGGAADEFILFTENITREAVVPLADRIVNSFDQLIELLEA